MASIFDTLISVYRDSHDNVGAICKLSSFLHSERHRLSVEQIRLEQDHKKQSELKRQLLPAATISGVFKPKRGAQYMVRHSGFMCVDIDWKDNKTTLSPDPSPVKGEGGEDTGTSGALDSTLQMLRQLPWNAYMARSCGGKGYFILVPLAYPERHLEHFYALEQEFRDMGIVIDKSCKDVCRLRYVSWDDEPYVNENAVAYTDLRNLGILESRNIETTECRISEVPNFRTSELPRDDARLVERCVDIIERCQIDIADSYDDWYKIGLSLASMGEQGRDYFHRISRQSRKYHHGECDKRFDQLMKDANGKITLGTFFSVCKDYGVSWR